MKMISRILLVVISMFSQQITVHAQTDSSALENIGDYVHLYVNSGFSMPNSPSAFNDLWNIGYNAGCGIGYTVFDDKYELMLSADYNHLGFDESDFVASIGESSDGTKVNGGATKITAVTFNIKHLLEENNWGIRSYLIGGAGIAFTSVEKIEIIRTNETVTYDDKDTNNDPTASLGFGATVPINNLTVFAEVRYQLIIHDNDNRSLFPVKIGLVF